MILDRDYIESYLLKKRCFEYKVVFEKDAYDTDEVVKVKHFSPISKKELHTFECKLSKILYRTYTCPICLPMFHHEYGVEKLKSIMGELPYTKGDEFLIDNKKYTSDFNVNGVIIGYFEPTYFEKHIIESDEMKKIIEYFEKKDDVTFVPVLLEDLNNMEYFLSVINS